jgi:hypothetical protein
VVEIATCLDPDGIDIRFLNRQGYRNVASVSQVAGAFQAIPNGATPLVRTVKAIFEEKAQLLKERKMLLIIATDGVPTDDAGNEQTKQFLALLRDRPKNVFVSIIACTDDDSAVGYLNKIDRIVPGIDVSDDYGSESKEVRKAQGKDFQFSYGDYIVKTLLGPIDANFDRLDEVRLKASEVRALGAPRKAPTAGGGCCSIM